MKSRKAVSSRKQEDSNDNLKSYFSEDKDLCEIHRRVCRYTEKFSPILLFIFYYKYHPNREVAAFREPLLVFSENLTRKGGRDTPNISQEKKKSAKPLRRELELYRENGVSLYLDGAPSTPKKIAKACQIAENGVYMRDYTEDEDGHIACVSFDLIRKE